MKFLLIGEIFLLTTALLVGGEAPVPKYARTYISDSLEVPAFTPPVPPVEKEVPAMRVDAAVTVPAGNSRTLTILRAEASDLPDIPVPVAMAADPARPLTPEELARQAGERRRRLQFNAMVYENGVSVIRWQHPDTAEPYEAICGFNVNLLAGLGQFTSHGKIHQLSFIPSGVLPSRKPPQAAPDSITLIQGDANDPIGTATATLLRDLIANEKDRLTAYQEKLIVYRQAAAEWAAAHPVLKRDETIWLKPHRGSRYLATPQPAAAR